MITSSRLLILCLIFLSLKCFAGGQGAGPRFEPLIQVPQDFALKIDSNLSAQHYDQTSYNVILTCTRKGNPAHKSKASVNCVALGVIPTE